MKSIVLILAFFVASLAYAQEQLPSNINDAFNARYPNAQSTSWFEDEDCYKIEFELLGVYCTEIYTLDGQWSETRKRAEITELPKKISTAVKSMYSTLVLVSAELIENKSGEKYYKLFGYTNEADFNITVSLDGKILSTDELISTVKPNNN